jgi:hypothetical protein
MDGSAMKAGARGWVAEIQRYSALLLVGVGGCLPSAEQVPAAEMVAQRFFGAVYGCTGESFDSLAHPDVRMSYPIFAERLGTSVLEGRGAVERFSDGFCQRWSSPEVTVHEVISDSGRVVMVWSFSAIGVGEADADSLEVSWGGISVFELDESGLVVAEYGEESTPGPMARLGR